MTKGKAQKKLIIDTDLGFDCDDAGALALACLEHIDGNAELLAVTHSTGDIAGARGVEGILKHYGVHVEIGVSTNCILDTQRFGVDFYRDKKYIDGFAGYDPLPNFYRFLHKINKMTGVSSTSYKAADKLILQKLSQADDNSVTLLFIGQQNNLAAIVSDQPSGYGNLSKYELLKQKTERIIIMGGNFLPYKKHYVFGEMCWEAEFNILADIESAKIVSGKSMLPLEYIDFNQGVNVYTGSALLRQSAYNPVGKIYEIMGGVTRSSWDVVAALYALNPEHSDFAVSQKGLVNIGVSGRTSFEKSGGEHRLIYLTRDAKSVAERIESLLSRQCESHKLLRSYVPVIENRETETCVELNVAAD